VPVFQDTPAEFPFEVVVAVGLELMLVAVDWELMLVVLTSHPLRV
jgi:hypothetical protein